MMNYPLRDGILAFLGGDSAENFADSTAPACTALSARHISSLLPSTVRARAVSCVPIIFIHFRIPQVYAVDVLTNSPYWEELGKGAYIDMQPESVLLLRCGPRAPTGKYAGSMGRRSPASRPHHHNKS